MSQDIEKGYYHVIVINPELLLGNTLIGRLWKSRSPKNRILNIIFDEAHCITQWGTFRNKYKNVGDLRYLISGTTPIYAVSATLLQAVLADIRTTLRLRLDKTIYFQQSNDCPDIELVVCSLAFPAQMFHDLEFLIPKIPEGYIGNGNDLSINKFVIFFDNMKEAERAVHHLQTLLPECLKHKIAWFHSTMTVDYRQDQTGAFHKTELWGLCATDAFGMVRLPN